MEEGWIKSYRQIMQKGWYRKSEYFHLWHHILYKAAHKPHEWFYKGQPFNVNTGQFITSRKALSSETGINESKVERILKCFEIEQQIEQQNMFTSRLISVINYEKYQQGEQQTNSKRTASEQRVNTINNDKKDKNENKEEIFKEEVLSFSSKYSREMLLDFFNYWSEHDRSGKMKFEKQKTWETSKRLATWSKNNEKFNTTKTFKMAH